MKILLRTLCFVGLHSWRWIRVRRNGYTADKIHERACTRCRKVQAFRCVGTTAHIGRGVSYDLRPIK